MKEILIKLFSKLLLPSKVPGIFEKTQVFLSGKKSYIAGAILILQGLLAGLEEFSQLSDVPGLFSWIKNIAAGSGAVLIAQGLAIFGIRAAVSKTEQKAGN